MPNQSWIKIQRDNGKVDYAPISRSKLYPEQSAKQRSKRTVTQSSDVQPSVYSTSPGHSSDQLYTASDNAEDSSSECNGMDGR